MSVEPPVAYEQVDQGRKPGVFLASARGPGFIRPQPNLRLGVYGRTSAERQRHDAVLSNRLGRASNGHPWFQP